MSRATSGVLAPLLAVLLLLPALPAQAQTTYRGRLEREGGLFARGTITLTDTAIVVETHRFPFRVDTVGIEYWKMRGDFASTRRLFRGRVSFKTTDGKVTFACPRRSVRDLTEDLRSKLLATQHGGRAPGIGVPVPQATTAIPAPVPAVQPVIVVVSPGQPAVQAPAPVAQLPSPGVQTSALAPAPAPVAAVAAPAQAPPVPPPPTLQPVVYDDGITVQPGKGLLVVYLASGEASTFHYGTTGRFSTKDRIRVAPGTAMPIELDPGEYTLRARDVLDRTTWHSVDYSVQVGQRTDVFINEGSDMELRSR